MSSSAHKYSLTAGIFIGMAAGILTGVFLQLLFDLYTTKILRLSFPSKQKLGYLFLR